ncbi:cache domain-containing protein [Paenibacillus sp. P26]|nr:cache domain-containing protein [Paenibacillus sp. P26]
MKHRASIRLKLIVLYLITIIFPVLIIVFFMPAYYQKLITHETETLTEAALVALTGNIETYLDDLERMTVTPYLNDEIMFALKLKGNGLYDKADAYTKYKAETALYKTLPDSLENIRKDIVGTPLSPFDGTVYFKAGHSEFIQPLPNYPYAAQPWYKQAIEADGRVIFTQVHPQDYTNQTVIRNVFSVARLIKDPDSKRPLAVMIADADTVILDKIVRPIRFNVRSLAMITDDKNQLIYADGRVTPEVLEEVAKGGGKIKDGNETYVSVSRTIAPANWKITVLLSEDELAAKFRWLYYAAFAFAAGDCCSRCSCSLRTRVPSCGRSKI